jgi:hypothetical protein
MNPRFVRFRVLVVAGVFAVLSSRAAAQGTVDVLGGNNYSPYRFASAKGNVIAVERSVWLHSFELQLTITQPDTLTFFLYRHHSQSGQYSLEWTRKLGAPGATSAQWYSSGEVQLPLLAGNHYVLGVSWLGAVTYFYNTSSTGTKLSFGSWYSGHSPVGLPQSTSIGGVDGVQYHMRIQSNPCSQVLSAGVPCKSSTSPRLVPVELATPGGKLSMQVVDAAAQVPAVLCMSAGPLQPTALPIFGCQLWIHPAILLTLAVPTSNSGIATLTLPLPKDPSLSGLRLSWQTLVAEPSGLYLSNGLAFTL